MKQQTANWQRLQQGARDTILAHTQAKLRRQRSGRPPAAQYSQRVLRVIARFKAHTIAPPLSRRALLIALRDLRAEMLHKAPHADLLDDLDDLLFRLAPKTKAPRR